MTAMSRRLPIALVISGVAVSRLLALDVASADELFGKLLVRYGTPGGLRYAVWRSNGDDFKQLSQVVTAYRGANTKESAPAEREAFMINCYNARVIEMVLQGNPLRSIKDLSKALKPNEIFSRNVLSVEGRAISLDGLERKLLEEFKDPRVLFALHRASKSSPSVRSEAYDAARLEAQLEDAVGSYLARPGVLTVGQAGGKTTIVAPQLFQTRANAFKATGGALAFLAAHAPTPVSEAIKSGGSHVKLSFRPDDWSLDGMH